MKRRNFLSVIIGVVCAPLGLLKQGIVSCDYHIGSVSQLWISAVRQDSPDLGLYEDLVAFYDYKNGRQWTKGKGWEPLRR